MTTQRLRREDVYPFEQTWDRDSLYASLNDWEADLTRLHGLAAAYDAARPRLAVHRGLLAVLCLSDEPTMKERALASLPLLQWFVTEQVGKEKSQPER